MNKIRNSLYPKVGQTLESCLLAIFRALPLQLTDRITIASYMVFNKDNNSLILKIYKN